MNKKKKLLFSQWLNSGGGSPVYDTDAQAFFDRRQSAGDSVPDADKSDYNNLFVALKTTMGVDGVTSYFNSLDVLRLEAVHSKGTALANLINANHTATITNDYGGSFTAYLGLTGNGTNFNVNCVYNPGDGGTYKNTINSCIAGVLILNDANGDSFDLVQMNTTGSRGTFIRPRRASANSYDFDGYANGPAVTNPITNAYCYGWHSVRKTASGNAQFFVNGHLIKSITGLATNDLVNSEFKEFAAFTAVYSGWSNKTHGAVYAGSGNVNPSILHGLIYKYWLKPKGLTQAKVGSSIYLQKGDSMVGDPVNSNTALSAISESTRYIITNVNNPSFIGFAGAQEGVANRTLSTINGTLVADVVPYLSPDVDFNIVESEAMTNDLAFSSSITAAQAKALYDTFITNVLSGGTTNTTIIIRGVIDRRAGFSGGQTQGGFNTVRSGLRTLMLAEYNIATGITDVWQNSNGVYYIDAFNNPDFADASAGPYYTDDIHLDATGYDTLGSLYEVPIINQILGI